MSPETAFASASAVPAPAAFAPAAFPSFGGAAAERVDTDARARGHAAGYRAGMREAADAAARAEDERRTDAEFRAQADERRVSRAVAALDAAVLALHAHAAPVLHDVQTAIAAAAVDIAEALVGAQLRDAGESARSAMTRALSGIDAATVVEVRMNADDLAALPAAERVQGIDFVADPDLSRGDAVTRFPDGFLDARIATAVSRVRSAIAEQQDGAA